MYDNVFTAKLSVHEDSELRDLWTIIRESGSTLYNRNYYNIIWSSSIIAVQTEIY